VLFITAEAVDDAGWTIFKRIFECWQIVFKNVYQGIIRVTTMKD